MDLVIGEVGPMTAPSGAEDEDRLSAVPRRPSAGGARRTRAPAERLWVGDIDRDPAWLMVPIDTERSTGWALAQLTYCLGRDAWRAGRHGRLAWQRAKHRRSFRALCYAVATVAVGGGGAMVDQRLHILRLLLRDAFR